MKKKKKDHFQGLWMVVRFWHKKFQKVDKIMIRSTILVLNWCPKI
jgi:hypothetical protein